MQERNGSRLVYMLLRFHSFPRVKFFSIINIRVDIGWNGSFRSGCILGEWQSLRFGQRSKSRGDRRPSVEGGLSLIDL